MKRRTFLSSSIAALTAAACGGGGGGDDGTPVDPDPSSPALPSDPSKAATIDAMKRATVFMDESVSHKGGYVWAYQKDNETAPISKWWGEMEAYPTMCWMQPVATPTMGNMYLDAYHAWKDEAFYKAAERTALAVAEAQHPAGGWNYIYDFAGTDSLKHWYETVGINGWRLEEFQHYYGNATFDDQTTAEAAQFMLRMYLEKKDPRFKESIDKAIQFVLDSQFKGGIADGGWPQRWPVAYNATKSMPAPNWPPTGPNWTQLVAGQQNGDYVGQGPGGPGNYTGIFCGMEDGDYTRFVTFNDAVMEENIKLLFLCVFGLGRMDLKDAAVRAMDCMYRLMYRYDGSGIASGYHGHPAGTSVGTIKQAGWGLQHLSADTVDAYGVLRPAGSPAAARSYEARGLSPSVSVANIAQLCYFFRLTGDKKYLIGLDDVLDWVDTCLLRPDQKQISASNPGGDPESILPNTHARVIELETNRPRFVHRYGSNIWNGAYYADYSWRNTPSHYGVSQNAATASLRTTLAKLKNLSNAEIAAMLAASPLNVTQSRELPKYFYVNGEVKYEHLFTGAVKGTAVRNWDTGATNTQTKPIVDSLDTKNYWQTSISTLTNPFTQNGPATPYLGKEYMSRHVGDVYDTSPYGTTASQMPAVAPYNDGLHVPVNGLSTSTFCTNMSNLISFLDPVTEANAPDYKA